MIQLNLLKKSKIEADMYFLDTFQFQNKCPLPPSYQHFCSEFGFGKLCNLFLIYVPSNNDCDAFQVQNKAMKSLFDGYLNPPLSSISAHIDLIKRAEPFAMSENGEFLFWDIEHPLPNGEFPIYFTNFSDGVFFAGNSIIEMIHIFTDPILFKSVLKFYETPLTPCFEGF